LRGTKQTKVFWFYFSKKNMLSLPVLLAACAHPAIDDQHVPPFARAGWAPFSRDAAVAIALREWRLFGAPVDDDTPGARPPRAPAEKPERQQGLWQRIGEYWWEGLPPDAPLAAATGIHDAHGTAIADDPGQPWSAAFISYVMRIAGAGARFPYSASHSTYINAAAAGTDPILRAHAPETYAPVPGDLICHARGAARALRFTDLPTPDPFTSHCDLVVQSAPGQLGVIGGNVDDAVTLRHVPTTEAGLMNDPTSPCLVILQIQYDR